MTWPKKGADNSLTQRSSQNLLESVDKHGHTKETLSCRACQSVWILTSSSVHLHTDSDQHLSTSGSIRPTHADTLPQTPEPQRELKFPNESEMLEIFSRSQAERDWS